MTDEPTPGRPADQPEAGEMPAAYVRIGLAAGALGYALLLAADLALGQLDRSELLAFLGFVVAVLVSRRSPRRGGVIGLGAALLETLSSFAERGMMTGSGLVLPVLVTVGGLFLGETAALATGVVALTGSIVAARWFGPGRAGFGPDESLRAVVIVLTVGINAALTFVAVRSHRRALAASEQARRRYRDLFESAPDGVIALSSDGRIADANGPAAGMFGPGPLPGRSLAEVLAAAGASSDIPLAEGRPERPALLEVGSGPRRRTLEVTAGAGGSGGGLFVLRETTERRALETQLLHSQRLKTVGQLAGGVAHDFNNLLTAIGGNAQLIAEEGPPGLRELAEEILEAQRRGSTLTRQLLAFARRDERKPRRLDLGEAVRGTERLLTRLLGERNAVSLRVESPALVVADQAQVEQVVVNLVTNARDASPAGAAVVVAVRALASEEAGALGCPFPGAAALLEVADRGAGMPAETVARIFEPFFTTKPRGQGTGLGLATVHGIVAQSGGHVAVESAPGEGTTFRVFLPLAAGAPEPAPAAPAAARAPAPEPAAVGRVVVAEDDPAVRALVQRVLEAAGYRVVAAASGAEALQAIAAGDPPGLLLTDMAMPGLSGLEVAQRARARWPGLAVLFMTGYFELAGALPAGEEPLQKPFSPEELLRRVRAAARAAAPLA